MSSIIRNTIRATPDLPGEFAFFDTSIKIATPDLIQIDEEAIPIDVLTNLLYENIGGKEIINIARNDLINGQKISYSLLGNISSIQKLYNSTNIFRLAGTSNEFFANFAIKLENKTPNQGTAPPRFYAEEGRTIGLDFVYPVFIRFETKLYESFSSQEAAEAFVAENNVQREIVYSDPLTGNIVVDVINMQKNEIVQVEILGGGSVQDDTIY
jgi:hypothetical protein